MNRRERKGQAKPYEVFSQVWRVDRHLSLTVNYAHFFSGSFLKDTGPAHDVDYSTAWLTYKF